MGDDLALLYEQDILGWAEETAAQLRARDWEHLDLEHLIAEVEALGISQKKELIRRLVVLLEHLLKRLHVSSPNDYRGWEQTIRTQQTELTVLLDVVPSLRSRWDISLDKAWPLALKNVRQEYPSIVFPAQWEGDRTIEALLDRNFGLPS
ncbi:MAG TPA: DUF29 domain-containing protein [Cyanobacteria bacterium UBA8156]|jgi:hypothetical protein|nr:DUF29 domain-containing protein [Cyanobacteria bacterium UBA8156]